VLALSTDGKSLYVAGIYNGRWDEAKPVPCVWRIDLDTRECEVFLGRPDESGMEKYGPGRRDYCDKRVYAADRRTDPTYTPTRRKSAPVSLERQDKPGPFFFFVARFTRADR